MTHDGIEMLNGLTEEELEGCLSVLAEGEAVNLAIARKRLPECLYVAVRREGQKIVAVGAIKPQRRDYAAGTAIKAGFSFDPAMHEFGYVAVSASQQNKGLSRRIAAALLSEFGPRPLFATTSNPYMKSTLEKFGFSPEGKEWQGDEGNSLSLWLRDADSYSSR